MSLITPIVGIRRSMSESREGAMFTIQTVNNLEWCDAEQTMFRCMVKYVEFNEVLPVGVNATDPYAHIKELWANGNAGKYGAIAPYTPPPEPPTPEEESIAG